MLILNLEPNVADPGGIANIQIAGNTSGLSYAGVGANLVRYGTTDVAYSSPQVVQAFALDQNGQAAFPIQSGTLGGGQYILGVLANGERGVTSIDVSMVGALSLVLDDLLCAFRHIQRFEEQGRLSEDGTVAKFGWGNWHLDSEPTILKGITWVQNTSLVIDYKKGQVYFPVPLRSGEEVRGTYSFRMLDLSVYRSLFTVGIGLLNNRKPQTTYDLTSFPAAFASLLLLYAYIEACKILIPKMSTFAYRRLFENPDQLVSSLEANLQAAMATFNSELPTLKRRGMIQPAGISTFRMGQQGSFVVDEINMQQFLIGR